MLSQLQLSNFKSWKSLDLQLAPVTLLFGTNSSGKTSILQSLLMLKQTASNFDRGQPIYFGGMERDYVNLGNYRELVFRQDADTRISLLLRWDALQPANFGTFNETRYQSYQYDVRWRGLSDRVVIEKLEYEADSGQDKIFFKMDRKDENNYSYKAPPKLKDTRGRNADLESPESCYAIPVKAADYYSDFEPLEFNRQFEQLMSRILYLGPLRRSPRRDYAWSGAAPSDIGMAGENTIEALIASERRLSTSRGSRKKSNVSLVSQVGAWLQHLGLVSSFGVTAIDQDGRYYKTVIQVNEGSTESTLVDVGFGISQVLPVITQLLFAPEGSIILIEQPELHLHPLAQTELADLFLHVAEKRNVQLIVESHSEHLLRRMQRRIAEPESEYATPNNVKSYFCSADENGSQIKSVNINLFGEIENWPNNFFGDVSGELEATLQAGIKRRRAQLATHG